jgi:CheY-like chemotaxis protein
MYKGRALLVDDLADVRVTLSGLLSDEGYHVRSASSRVEALQALEAERFHVAILDVRLDETDEGNQDGLLLMHEIEAKYPTVVTIMLTAYADVKMVRESLEPSRKGTSPAFAFLEKSEAGQLLEYVKRAFQEVVRIDAKLEIHDSEQFLSRLHKKLRFVYMPRPPKGQLQEEADELLRKLCFGCKKIEVQPIKRGYSGVAVTQVIPWYRERGRGEARVAKFGEHFLVEKEIHNYRELVQGLVGGHRLPHALETARTRSLSGILYTFAGLGTPQDFATFYRSSDTSTVLSTLHNLFEKTCFPWRCDSGFVRPGEDLRETYMQLLRLTPDKLRVRLDKTMGGRHPFHKDDDGKQIWLGDEIALLNPVEFVISADLTLDSYTAVIHGDLNGYNVLVDPHRDTWLIDFASTCYGPLLQDYASFETFLRLSLVECVDWRLLHAWDCALFSAPDLCTPELPSGLTDIQEIEKAHQIILAVRRMALEERPGETVRSYLIGLLFNALKVLTIMNLSATQRDHALISAALITARLQADA